MMSNIPGAATVEQTVDTLSNRETWAGVGGVVVANLIGATLVMLPFYKLGRTWGNATRLAVTLGLGSIMLNRSAKMKDPGFEFAEKVGGIVLIGYGIGQGLALLNVPGFRTIGGLMLGPDIKNAEALAQSGSGSVIGQEGIYADGTAYSFSDIKNAEGMGSMTDPATPTESDSAMVELDEGTSIPADTGTQEPFVAATLSMMHRGMGEEPMYSHTVPAPMGHGVTFNLGAETTTEYMEDDFGVVPSGGVEQNFGGVAQPSTVESPAEEAVGAYINSVDVGGAIAEGLGGRNAFVASRYPGGASTQPPVTYGAETHTLTVPGRAYAAQTGSVYDEFGAYSKPGTSAEADPMLSFAMPSAGTSGRGVTFWTAENVKTGTMGRHMSSAEGVGSVMGQIN
tara:strand:+ start:1286 stop:2473 length:1188 start_codon:yes stop_codon:yes gene_type:complete